MREISGRATHSQQLKILALNHRTTLTCIVSGGRLALKAYRLSSRFMRVYQKSDFSSEAFSKGKVDSRNVFEEVAIKVRGEGEKSNLSRLCVRERLSES